MRRIQLPSVALVAGVHAAGPMVHTPPALIKHPRLPVARGAEVHRLAIVQGAVQGGRAASRPCEGSQPSVPGAGLLAGRAVKGVS